MADDVMQSTGMTRAQFHALLEKDDADARTGEPVTDITTGPDFLSGVVWNDDEATDAR